MMSCHEASAFIEAIAAGDAAPDEVRAHVEDCPQCAGRLRVATRIERLLGERPVAAPPAGFTNLVMARVRRERWRTEQMLDWGFNIFIALGIVLILSGGAGLVWASGLLAIGRDIASVLTVATASALTSVASEARTFMVAALLLTLTLGVWWWAEEDAPI